MDEVGIAAASARSAAIFCLQHNHGLVRDRDYTLSEGPGPMELRCSPGHKEVVEGVLESFDLRIPVQCA